MADGLDGSPDSPHLEQYGAQLGPRVPATERNRSSLD
jgi:hypothetical protein